MVNFISMNVTNVTNNEINKNINYGSVSCFSFRIFLSARLLSGTMKKNKMSRIKYGCETWSLTLRKEHKLQSKVLRKIFGLKKIRSEEFRTLHARDILTYALSM